MVNDAVTVDALRTERALVVRYAPGDRCAALGALLALDDALAQILRTTREPMVGQMRLVWWRDALDRLDTVPAPVEPVLQAIATDLLPCGITGADLSAMTGGWDALLGPEALDDAAIETHARERGARLFSLAGRALGAGSDPTEAAGEGWALADLSRHLSDRAVASTIADHARWRLIDATRKHWSRRGRALGALALTALADLDGIPVGAPKRVARLLVHRLTGR